MKSDAQLPQKSQFDRQRDADTTTATARHEIDGCWANRAGILRFCSMRNTDDT
jgi:hypothetical protein